MFLFTSWFFSPSCQLSQTFPKTSSVFLFQAQQESNFFYPSFCSFPQKVLSLHYYFKFLKFRILGVIVA